MKSRLPFGCVVTCRAINEGVKSQVKLVGEPVFDLIAEMESPNCLRLYGSKSAAEAILAGQKLDSEVRWRAADGRIFVQQESAYAKGKSSLAADALVAQFLRPAPLQ